MNPFYELGPIMGRWRGVGGKTSATEVAAEGRKWLELCYNFKAQRGESQVEACAATGCSDCRPRSSTRCIKRHNMAQASKSVHVFCKQAHQEKQITSSEVISLRRTVSGGLYKWRSSKITIARICYIPKDIGKRWAE